LVEASSCQGFEKHERNQFTDMITTLWAHLSNREDEVEVCQWIQFADAAALDAAQKKVLCAERCDCPKTNCATSRVTLLEMVHQISAKCQNELKNDCLIQVNRIKSQCKEEH
jgi:hypothetical protein